MQIKERWHNDRNSIKAADGGITSNVNAIHETIACQCSMPVAARWLLASVIALALRIWIRQRVDFAGGVVRITLI